MSDNGKIVWTDLTVPNAEEIKDFYGKVVGWTSTPHDMGDYHDFNIQAPGVEGFATGICHTKGSNTNLPAQWLIYIQVADLDESIEACLANGGKVIDGPRQMGTGKYCVIQDPAGAVAGLISQ